MKICFWGNIAGALKGKTAGGAELQIAILAKALSISGHEVVVMDYQTEEDFITTDGIKVFKLHGYSKGIKILRTLTHRLPSIYQGLKAQKADIYYSRVRDFRHIFAYWAARKVKAKFILHMASDLDSMSTWMRLKNYKATAIETPWSWVNAFLIELVYPYLLRKADLVLVQHEGQKNILQTRHIKSTVLLNVFDKERIPDLPTRIPKNFVFVGALDKRKGFVEFFELVKKAPLHSFVVIGHTRDKKSSQIYNQLKSFDNVALLGDLNHYDTLCQIANSKGMISTSLMEGFPNIFIEAWSLGIPVLSLNVDPGDVIKREALGKVANGKIEILLDAMNNINITDEFANKAKAYVEHNHVLTDLKISEINNLFLSLL